MNDDSTYARVHICLNPLCKAVQFKKHHNEYIVTFIRNYSIVDNGFMSFDKDKTIMVIMLMEQS